MDKENNRGNLSEMERIHRGLEAFLEKVVRPILEANKELLGVKAVINV